MEGLDRPKVDCLVGLRRPLAKWHLRLLDIWSEIPERSQLSFSTQNGWVIAIWMVSATTEVFAILQN